MPAIDELVTMSVCAEICVWAVWLELANVIRSMTSLPKVCLVLAGLSLVVNRLVLSLLSQSIEFGALQIESPRLESRQTAPRYFR